MCGICGIINLGGLDEKANIHVQSMNGKIIHRGPDEAGFFSDRLCSLAMRRLAIIDVAHGQQPVYSHDRLALVFFNGEIYNFLELRRELINLGLSFSTSSDTEVIVNSYKVWGDSFVSKLRGMFAFCIYDLGKRKWILARDRFGEKPLYYYHRHGYLSFSSELGSLLEDRSIARKLNRDLLPIYLTLSYVPEPNTLIDGVKTLRPGHFMVFENDALRIERYFTPTYEVDENIKSIGDAADLVQPVWQNAVKRQMIADVPLGAFLSGGIDSSAVVATMQQFSSEKVKTFTVKFEEQKFDESAIAKKVSEKVGTTHHELFIRNSSFSTDLFWELIDKTSVPFPDSSTIPTYLIAKEIRKHVKVALSGDGGDEVFAGYNLFTWYRSIERFKALPLNVRNGAFSLLEGIEKLPGVNKSSLIRQVKRATQLSRYNSYDLPIRLHALFEVEGIDNLLLDQGNKTDFHSLVEWPADYPQWSPLRRIMYFRLVNNLPLDMLPKVDRMSMANGLEVRAPFLDVDLFEVVKQIPDKFLMKNKTGKILIRHMLRDRLPKEVFNHPKKGFSIPLHKYQNADFWHLVNEQILNSKTFHEIFRKDELGVLIRKNRMVSKDNADISVYRATHQLWSLLQLSGWMSRFGIYL